MKKVVLLALALVALRWAAAIALLLVITLMGWQLFLHGYCGLPAINLLQVFGFYLCAIVVGVIIGVITETVRSKEE